ncbi:MAG TPA: aldo/keto reductase [Bauldia sp.]|nr:aldo/keto reductase [Bauldia sp.]
MKYTRLGTTGTTVSRICLGMMSFGSKSQREWVLEEADARPLIKKAIDLGITFFDTADVYSTGDSEEITGRALKDFGPPREEIVVATKVNGAMGEGPNMRGLSRKHILQGIDASLKRLGMDYVDLYQIHRFDPQVPIEETLEALDDVVKAGKALYIGASSMFAWQFGKMLATQERLGLSRFATMQDHYNLLYREEEREMLPLCRAEGIGAIPWSPLARGRLTRPRELSEATLRAKTDIFGQQLYRYEGDDGIIDAVSALAKKHGVTHAQVALAWLLAQPVVTAPIVGATKALHIEDAVAALDLTLDDGEMKMLTEHYRPHPIMGHQ